MQEKNPQQRPRLEINPDRTSKEFSAIHKVIFSVDGDSYAVSVSITTEDGSENSQENYRSISLAIIQDYREVLLFEVDERKLPKGQLPKLTQTQQILLENVKEGWDDLFAAIEQDKREEATRLLRK